MKFFPLIVIYMIQVYDVIGQEFAVISDENRWDWKGFLDNNYKVVLNDDISSGKWNRAPGLGLTKPTRTEAKLECDLYTEFKKFLMNYWEGQGQEGRLSNDKEAIRKPGKQVTFAEPPFDSLGYPPKKLPFLIGRWGSKGPRHWMKLKFHYYETKDDSWKFVHEQSLSQLQGVKCFVGKPGIPCQVNREIPHPVISNLSLNYKCYALHPSPVKNFIEHHAKTNRPPSDTSSLYALYEWLKSETKSASEKFGKNKAKLQEVHQLISQNAIDLGVTNEDRRVIDSPFKYSNVRDLFLNYYDKKWLRVKKDEDGHGLNPNRPLTYDVLPAAEVTPEKFNATLKGCKVVTGKSSDFKIYFCKYREEAYFLARKAANGREPVEEWHLTGNPFKVKGPESDPELHWPHFHPRIGPTGYDKTLDTFYYPWKNWPSFYVLPPSKNSIGTMTIHNNYVASSAGVFTHYETSFDPYTNDGVNHFKYGDSVNTKKIGEYACHTNLSVLDVTSMEAWQTIELKLKDKIKELEEDDDEKKTRKRRKEFWRVSNQVMNHPDSVFSGKTRRKDPTEFPRQKFHVIFNGDDEVKKKSEKKKKKRFEDKKEL